MRRRARKIVDDYLVPRAPRELNVDAQEKRQLRKATPTTTSFDKIEAAAVRRLETTLEDFYKSAHYRKHVQAIQDRERSTQLFGRPLSYVYARPHLLCGNLPLPVYYCIHALEQGSSVASLSLSLSPATSINRSRDLRSFVRSFV